MSVQLTFAMSTESSASLRVQSMLLPYDGRFDDQWVEDGDQTYLVVQVPEGGVDTFIDDVNACHPTVCHIEQAALTDVGAGWATR
jgi:hypothetical protein